MSKNVDSQIARESEQAAQRALSDSIPGFYQCIGAAQHDRRSGFIDPETGANGEPMDARLANELVSAAADIVARYADLVRAQADLVAALDVAPERTTRKTPAQRKTEIKEALKTLKKELGREPSQREIADHTGLSQTRVHTLLKEMG